jgi:hypothetical protein
VSRRKPIENRIASAAATASGAIRNATRDGTGDAVTGRKSAEILLNKAADGCV